MHLTGIISGNFRQGGLYPPLSPDGYTLVSVRTDRRMDYLPKIRLTELPKQNHNR